MNMKKLRASDWLKSSAFLCNTSAKLKHENSLELINTRLHLKLWYYLNILRYFYFCQLIHSNSSEYLFGQVFPWRISMEWKPLGHLTLLSTTLPKKLITQWIGGTCCHQRLQTALVHALWASAILLSLKIFLELINTKLHSKLSH